MSFKPTLADLQSVQGYLEREIERLKKRLAAVTKAIESSK